MSWGQHAHVPTPYISSVLYYTRYKDCGDGIVEVTSGLHNHAGGSDIIDYNNVPWNGVRYSTSAPARNAPAAATPRTAPRRDSAAGRDLESLAGARATRRGVFRSSRLPAASPRSAPRRRGALFFLSIVGGRLSLSALGVRSPSEYPRHAPRRRRDPPREDRFLSRRLKSVTLTQGSKTNHGFPAKPAPHLQVPVDPWADASGLYNLEDYGRRPA